jgi:hypothetical protein
MSYIVNKTNSSTSPNSYTVEDNVINIQTDLSLVGKGYAGYGEAIAENFLHLLENFSNTSAPTKPIVGQLWWDSTNSRLKVYNATTFVPAGSNAPYVSVAPDAMVAGDLWIDSDTNQEYFYNGSVSVLVGPPSPTGTKSGFTYHVITDSTDVNQNITKQWNDDNLIAIISEDEFTPKATILGFATIKKGITLSTDITDNKFQGTATDADKLGGVSAANYLLSNANDTISGSLGVVTDLGLQVGADSDLSIIVDTTGVILSNQISNSDITFKVNDGGVVTTVMTIDGSESRIGIGTITPTTKLDVSGTVNATAFTGPLTGNVVGNVTGTASLDLPLAGGTLTGIVNSRAILPSTNNTYDLGGSSYRYTTIYGTTVNTVSLTATGTATIGTIEATNIGFSDSSITVTGISTDGSLGGDVFGTFTNASHSLLTTEQGVKRYVDLLLGDISFSGNNITTISSNANLELSASGTGSIIVGAIKVNGTEISTDDSTQVTVRDGLTVTGAVVMMSSLPTSDPSNAGQLWNSSGDLKISTG